MSQSTGFLKEADVDRFFELLAKAPEEAGKDTVYDNRIALMEGKMQSLKEKCLLKMIFFGEDSLWKAIRLFLVHYHQERNHQGLDNRLIKPAEEIGRRSGKVCCRERLGGMLRYYYREAA